MHVLRGLYTTLTLRGITNRSQNRNDFASAMAGERRRFRCATAAAVVFVLGTVARVRTMTTVAVTVTVVNSRTVVAAARTVRHRGHRGRAVTAATPAVRLPASTVHCKNAPR